MQRESFEFNITEHIATLSETEAGYTKELNLISYKGAPAKLDIRGLHRTEDGIKLLRGIALTNEEAEALRVALNELKKKGALS